MAEREETVRIPASLVPAVERLLEVRAARWRGALVLHCDEGTPVRVEAQAKSTGKIDEPLFRKAS